MKKQLAEMFGETLKRLDIDRYMAAKADVLKGEHRRIFVVSFGKAAAGMAASLERLIGPRRASGIVVPPVAPKGPLPNFRYIIGGHPYPNAHSLEAAEAVLALLNGAGEGDLVVYLISGGGSALIEKPLFDDVSLEDAAQFHRVLVTCGANIYEMNVVRKHFSAVKGGRLAAAAYPAEQLTLYVSDVPADRPSTVASGPTMPDESTCEECAGIMARYSLSEQFPKSYRRAFPETPKPGEHFFSKSRYVALLSNQDGIEVLLALARERGWTATADVSCDDWPLEESGAHLLDRVRRTAERPFCLISGGELSFPVAGNGVGGRNQAFVLWCAMHAAGERIAVLSGGTDGIDGNSPAAGAVADGSTIERAHTAGLDPLLLFRRCDSYTFFSALGDTVVTGPTGNNVRDLRILLAY